MKPIYIKGMGVISRCAQAPADLAKIAMEEKAEIKPDKRLEFPPNAPSPKIRRVSRYARMAISAAAGAQMDAGGTGEVDKSRVGTIFSTGFGALENSLGFTGEINIGKPELSSPTQFTFSVANSTVGQICILNGYTGFSVLLTAGDPLEYSAMLLSAGKADMVFCGSVEEYHEELDAAIRSCSLVKEGMSEGAAVLALSSGSEGAYCKVTAFASAPLSACPYVHEVDEGEAKRVFGEVLATYEKPEIALVCGNGGTLDKAEEEAIREKFPAAKVLQPKQYFGETLDCGYLSNVALGAAMIKAGRAGSILASGIDMHGNYLTAWLEA